MEFEAVKAWLTRWTDKRIKNCRFKGILGFTLCPVALIFALTCVYWLLRLFTEQRYAPGNRITCLWITLAILPLMFIGNRLAPRHDLMEERMSGGPAEAALAQYGAGRSQVVILFFLWILFTGPRLVDWALGSFKEIHRLKQQDAHGCAAVLWLLVSRYKKVPYEDFEREIPWLDLTAVLPEVIRIPGVLELKTPPTGLGLTDDLRAAIRSGRVD
jgi:hypothetical protein